jgi:hypothetical protein
LQAGTRKIELELTTVSSNHHVELNPSDAGFQDRYVVQEIIKEMARNRPLDVSGNRGFKGTLSFLGILTSWYCPWVKAKLYFVCHMYSMQMMVGIIQSCHSNSGLIIF